MAPMTMKMLIIPTAIYLRFITKFIGSKFILKYSYIKKLRISPPAITEAI